MLSSTSDPEPPADPSASTSDSQPAPSTRSPALRNSNGWDGKLRMAPRQAVLANPEALSDPENFSDEDAPPVEEIDADEDLLEGEDENVEDIDLVHCRIKSILALQLERFGKLQRLCLRQNAIERVEMPMQLGETLVELDFYDNLIKHVEGLEGMHKLVSLDLSFNKIKHVKNIEHLTELTDLYFVQNRIGKIESLDTLVKLRQIELGGNRIREIENLEKLTALEELWLGKNKITEIKNLDALSSLRLLDLKSNRLTTISNLEPLAQLEELYLSHNAIASIPPKSLSSNTKLRVLDISNNMIEHLENLEANTLLEEFWASSNQLSSFQEVERELKDKTELATVYLEGNPLQSASGATYRNKVRLALPQVKQVDATFVKVS